MGGGTGGRRAGTTPGPFPPRWRKSITFDNGAEFARHYRLHSLGFETFFCDTRSPWQKGGVENANGRLRRYLPRRTDLDTVSDEALIEPGVQQYPTQVPGLPHARRNLRNPSVALEM